MRLGWGGWGVVCPPVLDLWYFDNNDLWLIIGQIKWGCWAAQREVPVSPFTWTLTSGLAPSHHAFSLLSEDRNLPTLLEALQLLLQCLSRVAVEVLRNLRDRCILRKKKKKRHT